MRILIATATGPKDETSARTIFGNMRESAKEGGLEIPDGIIWTGGKGCSNLAFDIIGPDDEAERFAIAVTMAFMPSKWCTTQDELPEHDTCTLEPADKEKCNGT